MLLGYCIHYTSPFWCTKKSLFFTVEFLWAKITILCSFELDFMPQYLIFDIFYLWNLGGILSSIALTPEISAWIVCFAVCKYQCVITVFTTKDVVIDKNLLKILRNDKATFLTQFNDCWIKHFSTVITNIPLYLCMEVRKIAVFWHNSDFSGTIFL